MEITRRSFLAGLGSVTVGLLFARKLDAVLDSLERDLVAEQQTSDQLPSAAEIVVVTDVAFRADRLVIPIDIQPWFVIEDIRIGQVSQFAGSGPLPVDMFSAPSSDMQLQLGAAAPGMEMRFRVRYVGNDPRGVRFRAALVGRSVDGGGRRVLSIDSGCAIVS